MNKEFKERFWNWLSEHTNFYVARKHHKDDIENAIDYCIKTTKK